MVEPHDETVVEVTAVQQISHDDDKPEKPVIVSSPTHSQRGGETVYPACPLTWSSLAYCCQTERSWLTAQTDWTTRVVSPYSVSHRCCFIPVSPLRPATPASGQTRAKLEPLRELHHETANERQAEGSQGKHSLALLNIYYWLTTEIPNFVQFPYQRFQDQTSCLFSRNLIVWLKLIENVLSLVHFISPKQKVFYSRRLPWRRQLVACRVSETETLSPGLTERWGPDFYSLSSLSMCI